MPADPQISVLAIKPLLEALRARGVESAPILAQAGLADLPVSDPDARLPLARLDRIWEGAAEAVGDPCLGLHLAETVGSESFGLLSYLGTTSPTWGEGLRRVSRYFRVLSDASSYDLLVADGAARVTAEHNVPADGPVRQRVEFTVAVLYCYGRRAIEAEWNADDVFFEHAAPADTTEHRRVFRCAPRFSAGASGFRFPAELLERPLCARDPALAELLERMAARFIAEAPPTMSVAGALRDLCIRRRFEGDLTLEWAAREVGMSPRTLQRRLGEDGTSYNEVIDTARRHVATRMLAQPAVAIAEVAFAVGFSEPAAFHRAFKRWAGMTPTEYRRRAGT
jgi:AraC-like DNA-binding protein